MESVRFLPKAGIGLEPLCWLPWRQHGDNEVTATHIDGGWYGTWNSNHYGEVVPDKKWRLSFNSEIIGTFDSAEEAKKYADEHHAKTHRSNLWTKYMTENDPPNA